MQSAKCKVQNAKWKKVRSLGQEPARDSILTFAFCTLHFALLATDE
jgi:hypothetical protein